MKFVHEFLSYQTHKSKPRMVAASLSWDIMMGKFLLYRYEISLSDITFSAVSAFPFIFMVYFTINWGHTAGMTYSALILTI